jgi:RNA polymerase sigma factor (sigma-70 family)
VSIEINEKILLKGLAQDDRRAIESIYKQHYGMIQTLILNNSGSTEDAKDIFQESVIVLYEKARGGTLELNCQIKTYLYSVCRRLWLKRLSQAQRVSLELENLEDMVSVEEELESHEQRNAEFRRMEKAMRGLGEPCRSLLESYYLHKKSMSEIAANFGYTNADNAKNQKYKCLLRLKKIFFEQPKTQRGDARHINA